MPYQEVYVSDFHLQPPLSTDRYPELNPTEALDIMNVWGL